MTLNRDEIYGPVSDLLEEHGFEHVAEYLKSRVLVQIEENHKYLKTLKKMRQNWLFGFVIDATPDSADSRLKNLEALDKAISRIHDELGLKPYRPYPAPRVESPPVEETPHVPFDQQVDDFLARIDRDVETINGQFPRREIREMIGVGLSEPSVWSRFKNKTLSLLGVDRPST